MRVTFVSPPASLSGGLRVIALHASGLVRRGHDVVVVASSVPDPALHERVWGWLSRRKRAEDVQPSESHYANIAAPLHVVPKPYVSPEDLPDADVLVATWWETAEWIAAAPASKGAKAYFIQGHEIFPGIPAERVKATWRLPFQKITISRWLEELARNEYGDSDVVRVPNAVDTTQFDAPARGKRARPTVGFLYVDSTVKGIDVTLAALARVRELVPDLDVVSFGSETPQAPFLLPEGTRFWRRPPQDEIRDIYAQCDVWLCGSRSEGFHLPPLEAMACRCPVVSTRVGGPDDIVIEGKNGHLVPIEDVEALAQRCADVLRAPEPVWRALSDAAYETAQQSTWDDASALFEKGLERALYRAQRGAV